MPTLSPATVTAAVTRDDRLEHPAVRAWKQLGLRQAIPDAVDTLRVRGKAAIYRLRGVGPDRSAVVAKRCLSATGRTERMIYEEILPRLPISALRFFGYAADPDAEFCWLFIEDAGQEPFWFSAAEHCRVASRWLAILHTSAERIEPTARLADRGTHYYHCQLRQARQNITDHLGNPALRTDGLAVFKQILATADFLESCWERLEAFCEGAPQTLVHGDLKENNMRVRHTQNGLVLLPFDWEIAGRGVPAVDMLKCPDIGLYWSEARQHWPQLQPAALQQLAKVGKVFRAIITIYWESLDLGSEWVEWPVEKLRFYHLRLAEAIAALGLK